MAQHEFLLGFKDLADRLGPAIVGAPVTDEFNVGAGPTSGAGATLQVTSTGLMVYASGGAPGFVAFRQ